MSTDIRIGCARWSIPKEQASAFPATGSHLERYAARFNAVEINSSFYRPHRPATYARWAASVPENFVFAVKVPKEITHRRQLDDVDEPLDRFLEEIHSLGHKLGPLLVQLPPSLAFDADVARRFFDTLRMRFAGPVVCEPRHESWFQPDHTELLVSFQVGRVAADPAVVPAAGEPDGWLKLVYYRLHGTPHMYYSSYIERYLDSLADRLGTFSDAQVVWCIFDNTATGAATVNALHVAERLGILKQ